MLGAQAHKRAILHECRPEKQQSLGRQKGARIGMRGRDYGGSNKRDPSLMHLTKTHGTFDVLGSTSRNGIFMMKKEPEEC